MYSIFGQWIEIYPSEVNSANCCVCEYHSCWYLILIYTYWYIHIDLYFGKMAAIAILVDIFGIWELKNYG